jgi:iron complex outermembrane receptor protein
MALAAGPAAAAELSDPAAVAQVDTVRVIADRLPTDVLQAPIAISEVRGSELGTQRQTGLDDALDAVPGVVAQSRSGAQDVRITIRGFGARGAGERSNAGTTRGIRIQLDGFPLTEPDGRTSLDFADVGALERVRVMRSNASGLYGSAAGGLIELTTHVPFSQPFGLLRTSAGSFGLWRSQAIGGLVAGASTIRFSVSDTRFDGWRAHSEATTTTLQASTIANLSSRTSLAAFLAVTRNLGQQPGALTRAEFDADPRQADPAYVAKNYRRENYIGRVGLRLQHDAGNDGVLLLSTFIEPKALHRAERDRYRDFNRYHVGGGVLYQYAVPVARSMNFRWSNGFDEAYQDGTVLFYTLGPNGSRGTTLKANKREAINSFGAYSQFEFEPLAKLNVSAGARYDVVNYTFEDFQNPTLGATKSATRSAPARASMRRSPAASKRRRTTRWTHRHLGTRKPASTPSWIRPPAGRWRRAPRACDCCVPMASRTCAMTWRPTGSKSATTSSPGTAGPTTRRPASRGAWGSSWAAN